MPKLHELLAVEGDLEGTFKKILAEAKVTFEKRVAHFFEIHKKLEMFAEDAKEAPEEHQEMVTTVQDKLDYVREHVVRYFDAVLQKEATNQSATADLVIDGKTIAPNLPATFLLGLESRLKIVRSLYEQIPTLPPGIKWEKAPEKGDHVYRAVYSEEKFKTAKTFQHKVLYHATKEHPAQIERWEEVENVGKYTTDKWSGMLSPAEKSLLLGRFDKVIRAVKKARQRANTTEVEKTTIAEALFAYINGE